MKKFVLLLSVSAGLSACATSTKTASKTADAPLETVNLKRVNIPDYFKDMESPYDNGDAVVNCAYITSEVATIEAFVGPDRDIQVEEDESEKTSDFISGVAGSLIPYGGALRYISGANAHDKKVAEAVDKGMTRRGYLKGIGQKIGCPYPASPNNLDMEPETLDTRSRPKKIMDGIIDRGG